MMEINTRVLDQWALEAAQRFVADSESGKSPFPEFMRVTVLVMMLKEALDQAKVPVDNHDIVIVPNEWTDAATTKFAARNPHLTVIREREDF